MRFSIHCLILCQHLPCWSVNALDIEPSERRPFQRLLYVQAGRPAGLEAAVSKAEDLTIDEYSKHGIEVTVSTRSQIREWSSRQPGNLDQREFQLIALEFARHQKFDAVGGFEVSKDGQYVYPWAISLKFGNREFALGVKFSKAQPEPVELFGNQFGSNFRMGSPFTIAHSPVGFTGILPLYHAAVDGSAFGILLNSNDARIVAEVWKDSPAERAGIQAGDRITLVNGEEADTAVMREAAADPTKVTRLTMLRGARQERKVVELRSESLDDRAKRIHERFVDALGKAKLETLDEPFDIHALDTRYLVVYAWKTNLEDCTRDLAMLDVLIDKYASHKIEFLFIGADEKRADWNRFVSRNSLRGIHIHSPALADFLTQARGSMAMTWPGILLIDKSHEPMGVCKSTMLPWVLARLTGLQ